jgi:MoaA/NifB/PqqE/SkfB family radical SAM enzyme
MGFVANYLANLLPIALGRQPRRPLLFSYYVTHRCTLNCGYCCDGEGKRWQEEPYPELTLPQIDRLFSLLRPATDTLDITGGEPLIRPDLGKILACAHAHGFRTILNTKGLGLEKRPEVISHTDVLVLSLDSLQTQALSRVIGRPPAVASALIETVSWALAERVRRGVRLVLSVVATPATLDDAAQILEFAVKHGCDFQISPEIVGTRPNPELLNNPRYVGLLRRAYRYKRQGYGILGVPEYFAGIRDFPAFPCHPLLMPVIRPDGAMYYPCLESKHAEFNLLQFPGYLEALEEMRRTRGEIPDCGSCCHIFCHMALSLLQRHPIAALGELFSWRNTHA